MYSTNFELIFVYGIRQWSNFIFCKWEYPVSPVSYVGVLCWGDKPSWLDERVTETDRKAEEAWTVLLKSTCPLACPQEGQKKSVLAAVGFPVTALSRSPVPGQVNSLAWLISCSNMVLNLRWPEPEERFDQAADATHSWDRVWVKWCWPLLTLIPVGPQKQPRLPTVATLPQLTPVPPYRQKNCKGPACPEE